MPVVMLAAAFARLGAAFRRCGRRSGWCALRLRRSLAAAMRLLLAVRPALLPLKTSTRAPDLHEIGLRRLGHEIRLRRLGHSRSALACRRLHLGRRRFQAGGSRLSDHFSAGLARWRCFDWRIGLSGRKHFGGGCFG